MRAVRMVRRLGAGALLVAALLALAAGIAVRADVVRVSRVLTGSMDPTIPPGSVVVSRPVQPDSVGRGDVVVFLPPPPFGTGGTPVVHRIVAVEHKDGDVLLRTKGDANEAEDPWTINASRSTLHEVAWSSPAAGRAADLLARGGGSVLLTVVVGAVAVRLLVALWRPRERRHAAGVEWLRDAAVS